MQPAIPPVALLIVHGRKIDDKKFVCIEVHISYVISVTKLTAGLHQ